MKITGIGRNLISLLDHADSQNRYVVYTNYDMKDALEFSNPNVQVKTYNVSKNSSMKNLLWTTFCFPFAVRKEKADLALIPNFTLLLFKFKKTVVIMHDLIEFHVPDKFSKLKMFYRTKLADPITAWRADKLITVSENSKRDIIRFLKIRPEKITVIYNGVDQVKFYKMEDEKATVILKGRQWPEDFLLYAGTIDHPGKNAMMVIKAFEQLRNEGQYGGKLVLAGMPGSGFEIVKEYIDKSTFQKDIILTGFVSDDELVALYSKCRVFVFVSLYEGFGIPPLEALSCGAKVVVSDSSSLPEVVGDVGRTVDPRDQKAVAEGIRKTLSELADANYEKRVQMHLENYKWENLSEKFETVLSR